jgi:hypothetical protein
MDNTSTRAIFWRAFFKNAGPSLGFSSEGIDELSDEKIVEVGDALVGGWVEALEAVGLCVGRGVNAYKNTRKEI